MMSRGYGAMLFKKSAAGLDHLKRNVSKFFEATLCHPFRNPGNSSNPTSAYGTLRQARRAACPAAAGRVDGRTRRRPAMRRGPARILTCFRGRVLARQITSPCRGGATGGKVCRTSRCQCRRRLEVCDGRHHRLHVLWRARSCSIRALLTQPRCGSGTAPHCFGRQGVSSVFRE